MKNKKIIIALLALALITGCSSAPVDRENSQEGNEMTTVQENQETDETIKVTLKSFDVDKEFFKAHYSIPTIEGIENPVGQENVNKIVHERITNFITQQEVYAKSGYDYAIKEGKEVTQLSIDDRGTQHTIKGDLITILSEYDIKRDYAPYMPFAMAFDRITGQEVFLSDVVSDKDLKSVYTYIEDEMIKEYEIDLFKPELYTGFFVTEESIQIFFDRYNHNIQSDERYISMDIPMDLLTTNLILDYDKKPYALIVDFEKGKVSQESIEGSYDYPVFETQNKDDLSYVKSINDSFATAANNYLEGMTSSAETALEESIDYEYDFMQWGIDISSTIHLNEENLISTSTYFWEFTGGAHGNYFIDGRTFDLSEQKELRLSDLFDEGYDYKTVLNEIIANKIENHPQYAGALSFESIHENQEFYLTKDNHIIIIFQSYEIGPYAAGAPSFKIDLSRLQLKKQY